MYHIYILLCPDTGQVRYVGKTKLASYREFQHRYGYGSSPVARWKHQLRLDGKRAIYRIIEEVEDSFYAKWREHWWIRYFRRQRQPILNVNTISPETAKNIKSGTRHYRTSPLSGELSLQSKTHH